jgi:hypothetical protein
MKQFSLTTFFAAILVIAGAWSTSSVAEEKGELSLRSVRLITGFALTTIPSEIKEADGTVFKIDRSDMSKILVPIDDARRIIQVARLSAHAQLCDMPQLQAQNYLAMMREEQAKNIWTKEQLLFINRLHLFTVMWLSGNVRFVDKGDGTQEAEIISDPDETKTAECTEEDRVRVQTAIENFVKSTERS